jgi:hypothetical protein
MRGKFGSCNRWRAQGDALTDLSNMQLGPTVKEIALSHYSFNLETSRPGRETKREISFDVLPSMMFMTACGSLYLRMVVMQYCLLLHIVVRLHSAYGYIPTARGSHRRSSLETAFGVASHLFLGNRWIQSSSM